MMKRFKEPLKTLLILLLTASAVFMAWKGSLFNAFFPARHSPVSPTPEAPEQSYTAAALPVAASVTGPGGLCCGVKYDAEAMEELFEGFSAILSEALGSAEAPESIGRFTWQDRLQEESLYLDYGFSFPISALAAWVGVEAPWAGSARGRAFLLDNNGSGNVRLSFHAGDGHYFQCDTAASWLTLRSLLEGYRPNGAAFAFQLPALHDCDSFLLVLEQLPEVYGAHVTAAGSAAAGACGELFGINLGSQSRYTEADGTLVYPGENGVLRLWADGSVSYSTAEEGRRASTPADQIEETRKLLEAVHAAFAGEETLALRGAEEDEAGDLTLSFCYLLGGLRLDMAEGSAATAVWKDGKLSELTLRPRRCRRAEASSAALLPELQAAAAAGSIRRGAAPELVLPEIGEERTEPVWIVTVDGRNLWTQED